MPDLSLTVAISTFNRASLVGRAIDSVLAQHTPVEIIVVDDASEDDSVRFISERYPHIRLLRQAKNAGCCAARNRAIREATSDWVLILDDDDVLLADAISTVLRRIAELQPQHYPVIQFAHGNGSLRSGFEILRLEHYVLGHLKGDFVPVINRKVFLDRGLAYPELKSAGEHLLWWTIAQNYGIPTWSERIGKVNSDAPLRLTSARNQLARARDYAELQELSLERFGQEIARISPEYRLKKELGAAVYWILAGERGRARERLRRCFADYVHVKPLIIYAASFLPVPLLRYAFARYREYQSAASRI